MCVLCGADHVGGGCREQLCSWYLVKQQWLEQSATVLSGFESQLATASNVEISRPPDGPVLTDPNCHVEKMDLSHLEGFTLGDGACAPLPFLAPREGMKVRKGH